VATSRNFLQLNCARITSLERAAPQGLIRAAHTASLSFRGHAAALECAT
jgi:hypothetical protein